MVLQSKSRPFEPNAGRDLQRHHKKKVNLDLILDANTQPTFARVVTDKNLSKFIMLEDMMKALFQALPISILQYVTNTAKGYWNDPDGSINWFIMSAFIISVVSVLYNLINLQQILFSENISVFMQTIKYLNKKMQQQKNKKSIIKWRGLGDLYEMPSTILIDSMKRLEKISQIRNQPAKNIKEIYFQLSSNENYNKEQFINDLIDTMAKITQVEKLVISLE